MTEMWGDPEVSSTEKKRLKVVDAVLYHSNLIISLLIIIIVQLDITFCRSFFSSFFPRLM
jgi:hypothetical protein